MRTLLVLVSALAVLAVSARPPDHGQRPEGALTLPRPAVLRGLFAGHLHLVTDYFWLLTINRVGAAKTPAEHRDIYAYADLVTDLDPQFRFAYTFSAITLPTQQEDGSYANLREAEKLLRKGLQTFPGNRTMLFQIAFNKMFYEGEYREAAEIFQDLATDPTAPEWYASLATRLYAAGGELDSSEYLTRRLLESCFEPEACEAYERRLVEIEQERVLRVIDDAVERFEASHQRRPRDVDELMSVGLLHSPPRDPFGGEIFIDPEGRARSTATKHRLELIRGNKKWSPGSPPAP